MSTQLISRPFEEPRGFNVVPSNTTTSNLIGGYRRESDFGDVHIYDASDISRIVHTYDIVKERENASSQENIFLGYRHWVQGYWDQDSELTSDYEPFAMWATKNVRHAAESPKAPTPWGLVTLPSSLKEIVAGISDIHLLDAVRGWWEVNPEITEKKPSAFTVANATIRWNPDAFSDLLKTAIANMPDTQLLEALHDWNRVKHEAVEEGFPVPTDMALENSRRMLIGMYSISSRRFEVYPTPDGEVAIDAPGGFRRSILLLCDSDGGALCLVNINGEFRRAHYSDTDKLPDGFIREALVELEQTDDAIK